MDEWRGVKDRKRDGGMEGDKREKERDGGMEGGKREKERETVCQISSK